MKTKVRWAELLPREFRERLAARPIAYLPLGICEPHGQIAAYGLDSIKADYLCEEAARRYGGIVAPTLGYQIHEAGYHAPWLVSEVGEGEAPMTGVPPQALLYFFLYQLRAFVNAGFRGGVVVTGHSGGNQADLRLAADAFRRRAEVPMWVGSDPELVEGTYAGDHAGKYEISQLMALRPELVDFSLRRLETEPGAGGRLALGADAEEASAELGERILEASLARLGGIVETLAAAAPRSPVGPISYAPVEDAWAETLAAKASWRTASPYPGQRGVPEDSRWKPYEYL
ncbi:creatininase family protein [Paenibacillus antri]|uniref:Creatininase family protein n=1 Tax=Paenibacillus antri TaxID=2582848 RepID=A0A5R9GJK1_9BACL|nr:creatininase family protein [Paenibacillus antri]TLS53684.1 creatininase family protein [Paenibacillus antri]